VTLLVEGLVKEIVYSSMLEKLYGGKQVKSFLTSDPNMVERRVGRGGWEPL